jgi:hypothetical protein
MRNLYNEAIAVGILFVILFAIVHVLMMNFAPKFSMGHAGIGLCAFLAGAIGHLLFEHGGLNAKFCQGMAASEAESEAKKKTA